MTSRDTQPAVKDDEAAHPVAGSWRPIIREIVAALARGDLSLTGLTSVVAAEPKTQYQIKRYLADYGETLVALPDETWTTSIAQWMQTHWDVLVDLWTKESGKSDLVLSLRVFEEETGQYRLEVDSVHVP